jgi:hypothetical protein
MLDLRDSSSLDTPYLLGASDDDAGVEQSKVDRLSHWQRRIGIVVAQNELVDDTCKGLFHDEIETADETQRPS